MCGQPEGPKRTAADKALAKRTAQQAVFEQQNILGLRRDEMGRANDKSLDEGMTSWMQGRAAADAAAANQQALIQRVGAAGASGVGPGSNNVAAGIDASLRGGANARLQGLTRATNQAMDQRRSERVALLNSAAGNSGAMVSTLSDRARQEESLAMSRMQNDMAVSQAWSGALTGAAVGATAMGVNEYQRAGNADISNASLSPIGQRMRTYQQNQVAGAPTTPPVNYSPLANGPIAQVGPGPMNPWDFLSRG